NRFDAMAKVLAIVSLEIAIVLIGNFHPSSDYDTSYLSGSATQHMHPGVEPSSPLEHHHVGGDGCSMLHCGTGLMTISAL
ncbi:MAG: hypothetical protein OXQ30_13215, partial [Boseongicola sp.]|nr:hypothetical protein [Boseongicola sp.]